MRAGCFRRLAIALGLTLVVEVAIFLLALVVLGDRTGGGWDFGFWVSVVAMGIAPVVACFVVGWRESSGIAAWSYLVIGLVVGAGPLGVLAAGLAVFSAPAPGWAGLFWLSFLFWGVVYLVAGTVAALIGRTVAGEVRYRRAARQPGGRQGE
jgi:hypothetical protein